jgi:putative restriction endonuclease
MGFGVFIHKQGSGYADDPSRQYQFPPQYLSRAATFVGDWIVYYEPVKERASKGYYAIAQVAQVVPDPSDANRFLALIEPGSYLEFPNPVAFSDAEGLIERGLLNEAGRISGRAQAAVRPISPRDFDRILQRGLAEEQIELPRLGMPDPIIESAFELGEMAQSPFVFEQERERVARMTTRTLRDKAFRRLVVRAYDKRCAVTGMKLINGGGRAEVEAAHIRPVEASGPDSVNNGLALSGTAHWMFDRGLIGIGDGLEIIVSRQVNDRDSIENLINRSGRLIVPDNPRNGPHPAFLSWHREHRFKH